MKTYYIDPLFGDDRNAGLSPEMPLKNHCQLTPEPGDTILFKCGSEYRGQMKITGGDENAPVTYGSYGEGPKPVFIGSVNLSREEDWEPAGANLWRVIPEIYGDVGNFVLDGECTATLRASREDLQGQGDFWDNRQSYCEKKIPFVPQEILMYSETNPAVYYKQVECVAYGTRSLGRLRSNIVIENLCFMNSGVHALAGTANNVVIRNCCFKNIGGCMWDKDLLVRFGNGVELWEYGDNILVEGCDFKNVYDSCVTHQGPGERTVPTRNFICRNNRFDTYGMAAFEYRDKMPMDSEFTGNVCVNAGCGFAMLGETLPRKSEIWPQPMGHHIFLWRIEKPTEGGKLLISGNRFGPAPVGAAIYSIISPEAEAQITLRDNIYEGDQMIRIHSETLN